MYFQLRMLAPLPFMSYSSDYVMCSVFAYPQNFAFYEIRLAAAGECQWMHKVNVCFSREMDMNIEREMGGTEKNLSKWKGIYEFILCELRSYMNATHTLQVRSLSLDFFIRFRYTKNSFFAFQLLVSMECCSQLHVHYGKVAVCYKMHNHKFFSHISLLLYPQLHLKVIIIIFAFIFSA